MNTSMKVGTRDSELAIWQAKYVCNLLEKHNVTTKMEAVKSEGDIDLVTPLYELGIQGIFTKTLDKALLEGRVDAAVHSFKDVPTALAKGLTVAAVLPRGNPFDVLVCKNADTIKKLEQKKALTIATCSVRRKAQWLHRFPETKMENIRGNVFTRIEKLKNSQWDGAIFAAAGLERLNIDNSFAGPQLPLLWMLPAPAQGAIVVVCRETDTKTLTACKLIHDANTALCTKIERLTLRLLLGGCSTPVSAYATIEENQLTLVANICCRNGTKSITVKHTRSTQQAIELPRIMANELLDKGGGELLA